MDLTVDSDKEDVVIVDLTSSVPTKNITAQQRSTRNAIIISESEDSDVVVIPSTPPGRRPLPPAISSPHEIICPICMDTKRTFVQAGRSLVTTKCGHLFCDSCLKQSIALLHKCPTCSGKLSLKQYHRIYL